MDYKKVKIESELLDGIKDIEEEKKIILDKFSKQKLELKETKNRLKNINSILNDIKKEFLFIKYQKEMAFLIKNNIFIEPKHFNVARFEFQKGKKWVLELNNDLEFFNPIVFSNVRQVRKHKKNIKIIVKKYIDNVSEIKWLMESDYYVSPQLAKELLIEIMNQREKNNKRRKDETKK